MNTSRDDSEILQGGGPMTRLARIFMNSKLTPLLILAVFLIGLFAISLTPRDDVIHKFDAGGQRI